MNIKNEETVRLARELARLTGESLTEAITKALRERLARKRKDPDDLVERWLAVAAENAKRLKGKALSIEDLYDAETGLPK